MNDGYPRPRLSDCVTVLPGVGGVRAEKLKKLEIETLEGLLRHYPRRYEDRRRPLPAGALVNGEAALVRVCVRRVIPAPARMRGGPASKIPMKVICFDRSSEITLLFFNARWLSRAFREGAEYWVYGTPHRDFSGVSMAHPDFEEAAPNGAADENDGGMAGAGIIPVYPLTAGVAQKYLRGLMRAALPAAGQAGDFIPEAIVSERRLAPMGYALAQIHFPDDEHALNAARYRLVYEELFLLQARLLYARLKTGAAGEGKRTCEEGLTAEETASLFPFKLTGAQQRAIKEIRDDMAGESPMNRLLQGDVGSGKTAVAAAAAWFAVSSGYQAAIMAPTEILARQHFDEFGGLFGETGHRVTFLSSGLSSAGRREALEGLGSGDIHIVIGTHAILEPDVSFSKLGLVVTDEQHRFGVRQRLMLREKGKAPDTLVMTATPIPRTLALMLYADLDVSVLDESPPGRKPVATRFIGSSKRDAAYDFAGREMAAGRQVYVVAPMIGDGEEDDADVSGEGVVSALALVKEMAERFPDRRPEVLHGRMKSEQKEEIMRAFVKGEIDMLVSTVVIEVGLNVPNATMMIVENAERFGLAQLHQLRGRVGRGADKSYCVLVSDSKSELAIKRGETLAGENDGFKIAELDLTLRGPGDLFGVRQHGLPELKIADPAKHMDILGKANHDAKGLLALDPGLLFPGHAALRSVIAEGYE